MRPLKLQNKKILIVDDEAFLRELLRDLFELEGARVTEASNGDQAWMELQKTAYDIVLSDVRMPGGNGIDLMKNIQTRLSYHPKCFLCSGFNDVIEAELKSLGVLKVFPKPFNMDEIVDGLTSVI